MAKVVITHNVIDIAKWLQFKSERAEAIAAMGGRNVVDHVAQDGSNTVALAVEVDDVAELMTALSSPPPELGAIMEKHGVVPPLAIYVEQ
jgi:chemotaxis signal transduction protein